LSTKVPPRTETGPERASVEISSLSPSSHVDFSPSPNALGISGWRDVHSSSFEPEEIEDLPESEATLVSSLTPVDFHGEQPIFVDPSELSPIAGSPELSPATSTALTNWSIEPRLSYSLSPSDHDNATSFFFRNYIVKQRHPDSTRGFLEVLHDLYNGANPSSLLHQATHAVSLASYSNFHKSNTLRSEGRKLYGKALKRLNSSIHSPQVVSSDETLMSILLFAFYEQLTYHASTKTIWTRHVNGAAAIIGMRGKNKFQSRQSLQLFRAVRTLMVCFTHICYSMIKG
jgi:hypothetical protein